MCSSPPGFLQPDSHGAHISNTIRPQSDYNPLTILAISTIVGTNLAEHFYMSIITMCMSMSPALIPTVVDHALNDCMMPEASSSSLQSEACVLRHVVQVGQRGSLSDLGVWWLGWQLWLGAGGAWRWQLWLGEEGAWRRWQLWLGEGGAEEGGGEEGGGEGGAWRWQLWLGKGGVEQQRLGGGGSV